MTFILTVLLLFAQAEVTTSSPAPTSSEQQDMEARNKNILRQLETLNSSDLSCQKKEDCETLGIGQMQCGGPSDYLTVSKKNRSYAEMLKASQKHQAATREYNALYVSARIGTCGMAIVPNVDCRQHRCVEVVPVD